MTYYRLRADVPAHGRREPIKAGTLLFPWRAHSSTVPHGFVEVTEEPGGWGVRIVILRDELELSPAPRWQEFDALLRYFMAGSVTPPNLREGTDESLKADLSGLAHRGALGATMIGGRILLPGSVTPFGETAFALCDRTQGGNLTGEARVLIYRPTWKPITEPMTAQFSLCVHEVVQGAGARPSRGWRPAHCSKCGLDLSVDSGD